MPGQTTQWKFTGSWISLTDFTYMNHSASWAENQTCSSISKSRETSSNGHLSDILLFNSECWSRMPSFALPVFPGAAFYQQKVSSRAAHQWWLNVGTTIKVCGYYYHAMYKMEINEHSRNCSKTVPPIGSIPRQPGYPSLPTGRNQQCLFRDDRVERDGQSNREGLVEPCP